MNICQGVKIKQAYRYAQIGSFSTLAEIPLLSLLLHILCYTLVANLGRVSMRFRETTALTNGCRFLWYSIYGIHKLICSN